MDKNKKIIIAVLAIIIIIFVAGALYVSFSQENKEASSHFNNTFMSGDFVGMVHVVNNSSEWQKSYSDTTHHIDYNMSTCKNASFLVDMYSIQGLKGPEERTFNGQEWDIYSGQGISSINGSGNTTVNTTLNVFMCVADKDNQSYVIYIIFNNNTDVNVTDSVFCPAYDDYIEPLLKSITLVHNKNVPSLADMLGIDQASFDEQAHLISEVKKGNQTAIQQLQQASS